MQDCGNRDRSHCSSNDQTGGLPPGHRIPTRWQELPRRSSAVPHEMRGNGPELEPWGTVSDTADGSELGETGAQGASTHSEASGQVRERPSS